MGRAVPEFRKATKKRRERRFFVGVLAETETTQIADHTVSPDFNSGRSLSHPKNPSYQPDPSHLRTSHPQ